MLVKVCGKWINTDKVLTLKTCNENSCQVVFGYVGVDSQGPTISGVRPDDVAPIINAGEFGLEAEMQALVEKTNHAEKIATETMRVAKLHFLETREKLEAANQILEDEIKLLEVELEAQKALARRV